MLLEIPTHIMSLFGEILTEIGEGNTVKVVPIHTTLTNQEAADLLNMSRPTFIKLLDAGKIRFEKTGNRRKVRYTAVQNYYRLSQEERKAALQTLSDLDQELGAC